MPRAPRLQIPGAAYHVTARAVAGRSLFQADGDWVHFLTLLAKVVDRHDWVCGAYCFMTTHYHVVIRTPEADLARGIQSLNACYAQGFNKRHGLEGHVFLRRYQSVLIEREAHLLELCRYLALNPVRAGLCLRAEDWPWSSYPALLDLRAPRRSCRAGGCSNCSAGIGRARGAGSARSSRTCPIRPALWTVLNGV